MVLSIRGIGGAGIEIKTETGRVLIDPSPRNGCSLPTFDINPNYLSGPDLLAICATHNHADHNGLSAVLLKQNKGTSYYGPPAAAQTVISDLGKDSRINAIGQTEKKEINRLITLRAFPSKHIYIDPLTISWRIITAPFHPAARKHFRETLKSLLKYSEQGQTLSYLLTISNSETGKQFHLQHFGSAGPTHEMLDSIADFYQENGISCLDALSLPVQGALFTNIPKRCEKIAERLTIKHPPRNILLQHYDDVLPMVTKLTNPEPTRKRITKTCPGTNVFTLELGKLFYFDEKSRQFYPQKPISLKLAT